MIDHVLNASLQRNLVISIIYQKEGVMTQRDIKVLGIDNDHITAFCYLRNQRRVFKKENILSASFIRAVNSKLISNRAAANM